MMPTGKTGFNIKVREQVSGGKMKEVKSLLSVLALAFAVLTAIGASQESWNLGSSDD